MTTHDADLWMVMAVIQEFRLDPVTLSLEQIPGFGGMTVTACRGFGQEKLRARERRSAPAEDNLGVGGVDDFTPKVKVEVVVAGRERADAVETAIARAAHTGRRGDGKIFSWPITSVIRVRTMETNSRAIVSPTPESEEDSTP